jgi:hypothetical protein
MALKLRNGIWHWRKIINDYHFGRSTKTGDKREAERIAALWEGEAHHEILAKGQKPTNLLAVLKAFREARKDTGGLQQLPGPLAYLFRKKKAEASGLCSFMRLTIFSCFRPQLDASNCLPIVFGACPVLSVSFALAASPYTP